MDRGDFDAARQLAETLRDRGVMETDGHGYVAFVLGVLTLRETERANPAEKKGLLRSAAGYLEIAHVHGFPPGREAEGTWLFGKCLYEDGRFADARPVLREALELNPQKASETRLLLAGACLNQSPPRLAEALEENRLALADGGFPSAARVSAQLQRAEILLDLEKYSDCLAVLDAARSEQNGNAEAMLLRGQALLGEVRVMKNRAGHPATNEQIQKSCQAAVGLFRKAQDNQEPSSPTGAKAMYLVGVCLLEQGDLQGALRQFERTRLLHPSTPEALAANLRQAEILRQLHRDDESMAEYRRVLRSAGDGETYSNRWFPLEELRDRILDAYQHDLGDRKYERCLELVKHFCPVFPVERKILATAEAEQAWGRDLVNQAGEPPLSHGEAVLRRGREHLRSAGGSYAGLAKIRFATRQYPDDLWESATCYLEGHDYRSAATMLQEYLKNEVRRRRPQALLRLGESLLAIGRLDDALQSLREMRHPLRERCCRLACPPPGGRCPAGTRRHPGGRETAGRESQRRIAHSSECGMARVARGPRPALASCRAVRRGGSAVRGSRETLRRSSRHLGKPLPGGRLLSSARRSKCRNSRRIWSRKPRSRE